MKMKIYFFFCRNLFRNEPLTHSFTSAFNYTSHSPKNIEYKCYKNKHRSCYIQKIKINKNSYRSEWNQKNVLCRIKIQFNASVGIDISTTLKTKFDTRKDSHSHVIWLLIWTSYFSVPVISNFYYFFGTALTGRPSW